MNTACSDCLNKLRKDNERHGKVREEIPKGFSLTQGTASS